MDGVLSVVSASGQLQVVIGNNVDKVYEELCALGGFAKQAAIDENLDKKKREPGGKGFRYLVKNGQKICAGDPLIAFDRAAIQAAGHSDAIAVIVTNSDAFSAVELKASGATEISTLLLKVQP